MVVAEIRHYWQISRTIPRCFELCCAILFDDPLVGVVATSGDATHMPRFVPGSVRESKIPLPHTQTYSNHLLIVSLRWTPEKRHFETSISSDILQLGHSYILAKY